MNIDFIINKIMSFDDNIAVVTNGKEYTFKQIIDEYEKAKCFLETNNVKENSIISLLADFNPQSIAMFLALIEKNAIIVPISNTVKSIDSYIKVSQSEFFIDQEEKNFKIKKIDNIVDHKMLLDLKKQKVYP